MKSFRSPNRKNMVGTRLIWIILVIGALAVMAHEFANTSLLNTQSANGTQPVWHTSIFNTTK